MGILISIQEGAAGLIYVISKLSEVNIAVRLEVWIPKQMTFDMLVQVALLSEGQLAILLMCIRA